MTHLKIRLFFRRFDKLNEPPATKIFAEGDRFSGARSPRRTPAQAGAEAVSKVNIQENQSKDFGV